MTSEIEELRQELQELHAYLEMLPLESGGGSSEVSIYKIIEGQELPPINIDGIKYVNSTVTLVDDDPEVEGDRGDGMGRAEDLKTGKKIMIVHDADAPYGIQAALRAGDHGVVVDKRTSPGGTVYHYLARF